MKIAIDGPSGSGKTLVGRALAKHLRLAFLDTGIMYRAVTAQAVVRGVDTSQIERLARIASCIELTTVLRKDVTEYHSADLTGKKLRSPQIDAAVSEYSAIPEVRKVLVARQRDLVNGGIIMAGRDIGTVVLPDADLKFFFEADLSVRASRRSNQYYATSEKETLEALAKRDLHDSTRTVAPLKAASDAVVIDTSVLSADELVQIALEIANQRRGGKNVG